MKLLLALAQSLDLPEITPEEADNIGCEKKVDNFGILDMNALAFSKFLRFCAPLNFTIAPNNVRSFSSS